MNWHANIQSLVDFVEKFNYRRNRKNKCISYFRHNQISILFKSLTAAELVVEVTVVFVSSLRYNKDIFWMIYNTGYSMWLQSLLIQYIVDRLESRIYSQCTLQTLNFAVNSHLFICATHNEVCDRRCAYSQCIIHSALSCTCFWDFSDPKIYQYTLFGFAKFLCVPKTKLVLWIIRQWRFVCKSIFSTHGKAPHVFSSVFVRSETLCIRRMLVPYSISTDILMFDVVGISARSKPCRQTLYNNVVRVCVCICIQRHVCVLLTCTCVSFV